MTKKDILFFPNTPDDTHCFQACLKMILKHVWPEKEFGWEELDQITAKAEGKWTWPLAGALWLHDNGFEVKVITAFDYSQFAARGGEYVLEFCGQEAGEAQIANSDIPQEVQLTPAFQERIRPEQRVPSVADIRALLADDFFVICNVNARILAEKEGYAAHSVIVTEMDDENVTLHDPGLPPLPSRHVPLRIFEAAWAYPEEKTKVMIAVKKG